MPKLDNREKDKHKKMNKTKCPFRSNILTFCFWNAGGITKDKYTEIKKIVADRKIDAFALVEAGVITKDYTNDEATMQGYTIFKLKGQR